MIVGKRSTDGEVNIEASGRSEEYQFWSGKGVIFMQLEQSMIESSSIWSFQVVETKMKFQSVLPRDNCVGNRLLFQSSLLFHQALEGKLFNRHPEFNYL